MTEIQKTHIVQSFAGHDKEKLFYVLDTQGAFLLLADGKTRKIASPKRKKRKHVSFHSECGQPAAGKALLGQPLTDGDIRKTLGILRKQAVDERMKEGVLFGQRRYD